MMPKLLATAPVGLSLFLRRSDAADPEDMRGAESSEGRAWRGLACVFLGLTMAACASHAPLCVEAPLDEEASSFVDLPSFDAPQRTRSRGSGQASSVQGLVGVTFFDDDLEFSRTAPMDPNTEVDADLTTMPTIGFGGQYRLWHNKGGDLEAGLDGTLLFSWWRDSSTVRAIGGGTVIVSISTRMFITDIGFGGYVSKRFGDKMRVYAGAGPLVQFADAKFENELDSDRDSAFGVGGYARGGVEFKMGNGSWLGVGVRGSTASLDFGTPDIDSDALQAFVTITQGF